MSISEKEKIMITINGTKRTFSKGIDFKSNTSLADLLKERMSLTGLKIGCNEGACGACTVIMDGRAILSCMTMAVEADGHEVVTIEGLRQDDPVIEAFAEQCEPGFGTAMQCGYCTPGFVMATKAFLDETANPSLTQVREALSGNLCRCGCYPAISQAAMKAVVKKGSEREP